MSKTRILISTILLFSILPLHAANYYSCKDLNGKTTFSQLPCSDNAVLKNIKIYTPDVPTQIEIQSPQETTKEQPKANKPVVYKSKKEKDPCKGVSRQTLRNAQVSDDIMRCHSKKAVKDIYGPPSRIHL